MEAGYDGPDVLIRGNTRIMIIRDNLRLPKPVLLIIATLGWLLLLYLCWIMVEDGIRRSHFAIGVLAGALTDLDPFNNRYIAHPYQTLIHAGLGILYAVLGPLQFAAPIRDRFKKFHRVCGRILVPCAVLIGISAITIGLTFPVFGHPANWVIVVVSGALMIFAFVRAVMFARQRKLIVHREWMIRGYAIGISVAWFRFMLNDVLQPAGLDFMTSWNIVLWTSFPLFVIAAETWIRLTRPKKKQLTQE